MFYLPASTWWMRAWWPRFTWRMDAGEKDLYLTFDDGPDEQATVFVLDALKKYNAKASFFCVGEQVVKHPGLYRRIIEEGHSTGNHTQRHLNGWENSTDTYLHDVKEAGKLIESSLFRPPFGRIRRSQWKGLEQAMGRPARVIMWSVLSADFDTGKTGEQCFGYVKKYARGGSIVVFHDSAKAFPNLSYALPRTLEYFTNAGYRFKRIEP
jgi:peptidoglycan/xylan/chitin deacetylase (PgdA/CDA1 family)